MKLSSRVRYGTRALVELAAIQGTTPVLMDSVAENQGISRKYLDAIFSRLKAGGIVRSSRGVGGGFMLAKPAKDITLADVYVALEGPIQMAECVDCAYECNRRGNCETADIWTELSKLMSDYLAKITVQDLVDKKKGSEYFDYTL